MLGPRPGRILFLLSTTLAAWTAPRGASLLRRFIRALQLAVIIALAPYLALATVPVTRTWLTNAGWFDSTSVVGLCALAIVICIAALDDVLKRIGQVGELTEQLVQQGTQTRVLPNGVLDVYPPLLTAIEQADRAGHRQMTVLGLTLSSAWPSCIRPWLELETTKGWTIDLHVLSPDAADSRSSEIPEGWAEHARLMIRQVQKFKVQRAEELRRRNITVQLQTYDATPLVHGFRVDGALFIGFAHWNGPVLDEPHQFYDYFPSGDSSQRARVYRRLFENWVSHAAAGKQVPKGQAPEAAVA